MRLLLISLVSLFLLDMSAFGSPDNKAVEKGAFYDFKIWQCKIDGNNADLKVKFKVTILNARGSEHGSFAAPEGPYFSLSRLSLKVIDSVGKVMESFDKKDFIKICGFGPSYQVYGDICTYSKSFSSTRFPYSLEFEYEMNMNSLFFLRGDYFQSDIPVDHASFELDCPKDFGFAWKAYGADLIPTKSEKGDRINYVWQMDSIPAAEFDDYLPDGYPQTVQLALVSEKVDLNGYKSDSSTWSAIGKWYANLARDCYLEEGGKYDSSATDHRSVIRSIYEDLIDKNRYVAVSIGISGWKPAEAKFTAEKAYGDCKGLSTLLLSRLWNEGIKAYPALALTRGAGLLDEGFPNFGFNHVFVMALNGDDTIWMDPTCNICRFGEMPPMDENIPLLIVTDSGGVLGKSPMSRPEDNRVVDSTEAFIDIKGGVSFKSRFNYYGNKALSLKMRLQHMDKDQSQNLIYGLLPGGSKRYSLIGYDIANLAGTVEPLIVEIKAERKRPLDKIQNVLYIDPFLAAAPNAVEILNLKERETPIDLNYPSLDEHDINITWDTTYQFDSVAVAPDDSVVNPYAKFRCSFAKGNNGVKVKVVHSVNGYIIPVSGFSDFDRYRIGAKELLARPVKLYRREY